MRSVLAILILLTACSVATPESTPDLQPTVEALVNQRLEEKEREALIEVAVQKQLEAIRATSTPQPTPTPTATPLPTPTPEPTATPVPTTRPSSTATPQPTAKSYDVSHISWIDREIFSTGLPPMIPDWLGPYVIGPADPYTLSAIARGTYPLTPPPPGEIRKLPSRVWQGQELALISPQVWCQFSPTQRLMVLEYAYWLGNDIYDWLDQQSGISGAWNGCPPAGSY